MGEQVTTPSGLKYEDIETGNGALASGGQKAKVHYTGWLKSGQKFDSSLDRNEPFEFTLGAAILRWDEGVAGMKIGGKPRLTILPALAYGARGPEASSTERRTGAEVELLGQL
jgi:FKBP-type peptidyl-prolyl cis-trans isomerase FkpA